MDSLQKIEKIFTGYEKLPHTLFFPLQRKFHLLEKIPVFSHSGAPTPPPLVQADSIGPDVPP